jgi:ATP-dependent Clp protease ATP-binding subunit ClpA
MSPGLGRDLTALAKAGRLDPVVGRESEIRAVVRVLCRRTKSNPLLLGEPGVGKTALAEAVAQRLSSSAAPAALQGRSIFELHLGSLLAGTQYRGDLEQRLQDCIESAKHRRTILFIDEIHLLSVAGRGSGMDAANLLKPVLARGEVSCIGASTSIEAANMFAIDPAMERRFQAVQVSEPDPATLLEILRAVRATLEAHHHFIITDDAVECACVLSQTMQSTRRNPDRAIDLLEDACADAQIESAAPTRAPGSTPHLMLLRQQLASATQNLDLPLHIQLSAAVEEEKSRLFTDARSAPWSQITAEHVQAVALRREQSPSLFPRPQG